MVNNVNRKWFKNNKVKLFVAGMVLAIGLTGCGINPNSHQRDINTTSSIIQEQQEAYPITVIYTNVSSDVYGNDIISFTNHEGHVYNAIRPNDKGYTETNLLDSNGTIYSSYLDKFITIPTTDTDHRVELTIDYSAKTMDIKLVSLDKQK